jgi:hypothetical protein
MHQYIVLHNMLVLLGDVVGRGFTPLLDGHGDDG